MMCDGNLPGRFLHNMNSDFLQKIREKVTRERGSIEDPDGKEIRRIMITVPDIFDVIFHHNIPHHFLHGITSRKYCEVPGCFVKNTRIFSVNKNGYFIPLKGK